MSSKLISQVGDWILRNGRALEVSLWQYLFEGGERERVSRALRAYQNADGGFGHALEPDNWNTESSPYITNYALHVMRMAGIGADSELYAGALRYILSGAHMTGYGWRFSVPGNNAHPHAPWWHYDERANVTESIGLTCEICAFLIENLSETDPARALAERLAKFQIDKLMTEQSFGDMGAGGLIALTQALDARDYEWYPREAASARMHELVARAIEYDVSKWRTYCPRPSDLIHSPNSPYYPAHKSAIALEIDYTLNTREPEGVWPITWTWFDNTKLYPAQFAISENWWKAIKAIEKIMFLSNFGALNE